MLLDTNNMSTTIGNNTEKDFEYIKKLASADDFTFESLCEAKYSFDGFTFSDALLKDEKFCGKSKEVLVSTLPCELEEFKNLENEKFTTLVDRFCEVNKVDFVFAISVKVKGVDNCREILLTSRDKHDIVKKLYQHLQALAELQPVPKATDLGLENVFVLRWTNLKCTRKFLLPVINEFFNNYDF